MATLKVYCYDKCGTCRKAIKWLDAKGISYQLLPIRDTPPGKTELRRGLKTEGSIRRIINTSSKDYRQLGLKDSLADMSADQVFDLLQENGNLVKRPFVVYGDTAWAGFKPDVWEQRLS